MDTGQRYLPPASNTGAETTSEGPIVSVHWLSGTVWGRPIDNVMDTVTRHLGGDWVELAHGGHGYKRSWVTAFGVRVFATEGREDVLLVIPGEAMEVYGWHRVRWLVGDLGDFRATRLDLAFDLVPVGVSDIREYWESGRVRCRAHRDSWSWHENASGRTFTIGSRSSMRYMRVYDQRGFVRMELELKGEVAKEGLVRLLGEVAWEEVAVGVLREFIDFLSAPAGDNPDRVALADWWMRWVGYADRVRVAVVHGVAQSLERLRSWLVRQVSASLAVLAEVYGEEEVKTLVARGRARLGPRQQVLLALSGR